MERFNFFKRIVSVLFVIAFTISLYAIETAKVCLDGEWDFKTIDDFGSLIQTGKIKVPGAWDAQGYGKPTEKVHNNFVGVGVYEREIEVPANWEDLDVNIVLEGVSRYAKIWINEKYVGEALGLTGSHRFSAKQFLNFGKTNKIKIAVDSRQRYAFDAMLGAAQMNDYMEIAWGGLYGHVYFEGLPKVRLTDFYVRSNLRPTPNIIAEAKIYRPSGKQDSSFFLSAKEYPTPQLLRVIITDKDGKEVANKTKSLIKKDGLQDVEMVVVEVPNANLWSPENPYLYNVKLQLLDKDANLLHSQSTKTGIREFKIRRNKIYLNHKPIFLAGYGDDHIYPKEFAMPTDKQMYLERLRKIKALGFNHVRHHSTVMPREYFEACDEVGILVNAEFTIGYPWQMPGTETWRKMAPNGTDINTPLNFYKSRFAQIVKDMRNHVCIFAWVGGNEFFMGSDQFDRKNSLMSDMKKIVNELDPERIFVDTDGEHAPYILNPANDRNTLDVYYVLFDEWIDYPKFADKYNTEKYAIVPKDKVGTVYELGPKHYSVDFYHIMRCQPLAGVYDGLKSPLKPTMVHEMANFTTFTRPEVVDYFKGSNFKPFWISKSVEEVKKQGMEKIIDEWATASERQFVRLHKHNVEAVRMNPELAGYHWWLIQDYWTSSGGIFDFGFKLKKGIKPEDITTVNAQTVILQKGLKDSYVKGEKISADIFISDFTGVRKQGKHTATITSKGKELGKIEFSNEGFGWNGYSSFGWVGKLENLQRYVSDENSEPVEYVVKIESVANGGKTYSNSWRFFIIPEFSAPLNLYADEGAKDAVPEWWKAKSITDISKIGKDCVMFASSYSADVKQALKNGATVVLMPKGNGFLPRYRMSYKSTWWKAGDHEWTNQVGHFVDEKSPFASIAPEKYCAEVMAPLLMESHHFNINALKDKPLNQIRALSSLLMIRDYTCVASGKAFNGTLILSGLSHRKVRNTALNAWALRAMLSADNENATWDNEILKQ